VTAPTAVASGNGYVELLSVLESLTLEAPHRIRYFISNRHHFLSTQICVGNLGTSNVRKTLLKRNSFSFFFLGSRYALDTN